MSRPVRSRRRVTVHDFSSLQLHPDGSRVQPRPSTSRQASHAVRDVRGNWIARDAGGSGRVPRRVTTRSRNGVGEEGTEEGSGKEDEDEDEDEERTFRDERAVKRRKFAHDFSFLDAQTASSTPVPAGNDVDLFPIPSSDLLKCIHHFASVYYTERAQLFDGSREARTVKKLRRLRKLQERAEAKRMKKAKAVQKDVEEDEDEEDEGESENGTEDENEGESEVDEDSKDEDSDSEDEDNDIDGDGDEEKDVIDGRSREGALVRDMYKVLDGSALMVIGMLLQEHVGQILSPRIPEGWQEAMQKIEQDEEKEEKDKAKDTDTDGDASGSGDEVGEEEPGEETTTVIVGTHQDHTHSNDEPEGDDDSD